jgi:hypothetical protein
MAEVLIPYAKTLDGKLVEPKAAIRDEAYVCLECATSLGLRDGEKRQKHFYHLGNTTCQGESVIHRAAKLKLKETFEASLSGGDLPTLLVPCSTVRSRTPFPGCFGVLKKTFDYPFTAVAVEAGLDDFRLDLALLNLGTVSFGIELHHRHRVPAAKAKALPCLWIEVEAREVLKNPLVLKGLGGNLGDAVCEHCKCERQEGKRGEATFLPGLPANLESFDLLSLFGDLPSRLKAFLRPADIYLDPALGHFYFLFDTGHRFHYLQTINELPVLRTFLFQTFSDVIPLALGQREAQGYVFDVMDFQTSQVPPPRIPIPKDFEKVAVRLDPLEAKKLPPSFLKAHVGAALLERLKRCTVCRVEKRVRELWVIAPDPESLRQLAHEHRPDLERLMGLVVGTTSILRLVVANDRGEFLSLRQLQTQ